jgi:hypothetical protein
VGYSYWDASAAQLIETKLKDIAQGTGARAATRPWQGYGRCGPQQGSPGIGGEHDLGGRHGALEHKARLLELPVYCR